MAHYPSAIKRNRQAPARRARNRVIVGNMRSALKTAREAIESGKGDQATKQSLFVSAARMIDRAVTRGVMKRKTASRTISRLARALNKA